MRRGRGRIGIQLDAEDEVRREQDRLKCQPQALLRAVSVAARYAHDRQQAIELRFGRGSPPGAVGETSQNLAYALVTERKVTADEAGALGCVRQRLLGEAACGA